MFDACLPLWPSSRQNLLFVFLSDLEFSRSDFGEMGKQIFAAGVRLDGPESFRIIEPLLGPVAIDVVLVPE
jgi:hypothetical protein